MGDGICSIYNNKDGQLISEASESMPYARAVLCPESDMVDDTGLVSVDVGDPSCSVMAQRSMIDSFCSTNGIEFRRFETVFHISESGAQSSALLSQMGYISLLTGYSGPSCGDVYDKSSYEDVRVEMNSFTNDQGRFVVGETVYTSRGEVEVLGIELLDPPDSWQAIKERYIQGIEPENLGIWIRVSEEGMGQHDVRIDAKGIYKHREDVEDPCARATEGSCGG